MAHTLIVSCLVAMSPIVTGWALIPSQSYLNPWVSYRETVAVRENWSNQTVTVDGNGARILRNQVTGFSDHDGPDWSRSFSSLYDKSDVLRWSYKVELRPFWGCEHFIKGWARYGQETHFHRVTGQSAARNLVQETGHDGGIKFNLVIVGPGPGQ